MDYKKFYAALFAPMASSIGPIDRNTIFAIMGFDGGGPLNFCTIGAEDNSEVVTYVSCELAVRPEQVPTKRGGFRYELLSACDDEAWVRKILTNLGRMSLETAFDHGHTVDIGPVVESDSSPIQGVLLQRECTAEYGGATYGVLRVVGITRPEMEYATSAGSDPLITRLKESGVWPNTLVNRKSVT